MSTSKINSNDLHKIDKILRKLANPTQAKLLQRFFKTGKGEYGKGDVFLGLKVPQLRKIAKQFWTMPLDSVEQLLCSREHEKRMIAVLILVLKYEKLPDIRRQIFNLYVKNYKNINNWDLVDVTCPHIVDAWLLNKDKAILYKLSKSNNLWKKRMAMVATFAFIRENKLADALAIAEILLFDKHDLINKAVGWALREVGKKDLPALLKFLNEYAAHMPRVALRYSIEKLSESQKRFYLAKRP